ncbi:MAG: hypothetical protein HY810_02885 [Candidatus Omnitrophica bacterium]|nr:hypothetical protein [Candidatus Omnitrophota bacterium]
MFQLEIDSDKNILKVHLIEHFDNDQGQILLMQLAERIFDLTPGFKILTDLTQLEKMDFDAHKSIDKVMEMCNRFGVSKVIRVVANESSDIGFNIMSLFHYSHSVLIHTCKSLEEAERILKGNS